MPDVPTEADIKAMISSGSPYSASNKPKLEAYLLAQASGNAAYSFDANRVLMKLYQFFPPAASADEKEKERNSTALSLLLALLQYPNSTDMIALCCLVPERLKSQEPCATIIQAADLLDSCKFAEFWKLWKPLETNTNAALANVNLANHRGGLQAGIASVLALSYRTAPLPMVLAAMDMSSGSEVMGRPDLVPRVIESADDTSVYFTATPDNTKREKLFKEVDFNSISALMANVAKE